MANKSKIIKFMEGRERVISHPAGKDDKCTAVGMDVNVVIEKERYELKAAEKGVEVEIFLSTELKEGSTLKAYDGGKPNIVDFDSKRDKIEARNKTTNVEEYKKSKQKSSDREIG